MCIIMKHKAKTQGVKVKHDVCCMIIVLTFITKMFNSLSPESQPHFPRKSYLSHHRLYRLS